MRRSTSRKCIIRKHNTMSNETILANFDQLANHSVRLDAGPLTNHYAFLNFDKRTNETAVANRAFVEIDWFNNDNPGPKSNVSDLGLANVRTIHEISLLISLHGRKTDIVDLLAVSNSATSRAFIWQRIQRRAAPSTRC